MTQTTDNQQIVDTEPLECPRCGGNDVSKSDDQSLLGQLIFVCQDQRCRFGGRIADFRKTREWSCRGLLFPEKPEIESTILLYRVGEEEGRLMTFTGPVGEGPAMYMTTEAAALGKADLDLNIDEPGYWSQLLEFIRSNFGEEAVQGVVFSLSLWAHLGPHFAQESA